MRQVRIRQQRQLFGEPLPIPPIRFPLEVQEQLRKTLAQWMQSLSKMITWAGGPVCISASRRRIKFGATLKASAASMPWSSTLAPWAGKTST